MDRERVLEIAFELAEQRAGSERELGELRSFVEHLGRALREAAGQRV